MAYKALFYGVLKRVIMRNESFYRDELMVTAGRELRAPLSQLRHQTQALIRSLQRGEILNQEKIENFLMAFDDQTKKLSGLVDTMLDASLLSCGTLWPVKESFCLGLLAQECIEKNQNLFKLNQLEWSIADNLWFFGDRDRLGQVISILLESGAKFAQTNPLKFRLMKKNNKLILTLTDQGAGIGSEDLKTLFKRPQQTLASGGLFMAREIVGLHGGVLTVKSQLGVGTTFKIEFNQEEI
jgi:two-component system, sensor histidine kinase